MPVTNRGQGRLTPGDTTSTTRDYLNGQPPAFATLQSGLALFALFVIARSCACRIYSWFKTRTSDSSNLTRPAVLPNQQDQPQPAWAMDEKDRSQGESFKGQRVSFKERELLGNNRLAINPNWKADQGDSAPAKQFMSRLPPAPPLTPPELSTAVFTFEDRPRSQESFIHQPNPDYMSSTTTSMFQSGSTSPSTSRRRSYNKTLPIGVPVSHQSATPESDPADLTFSPSSYPPTSPLLPPAPPNLDNVQTPKEIGIQGEIISVLDHDGAGWTRHTRVYGGGVCMACAASGGNHGGGFYGATVRPEEMR